MDYGWHNFGYKLVLFLRQFTRWLVLKQFYHERERIFRVIWPQIHNLAHNENRELVDMGWNNFKVELVKHSQVVDGFIVFDPILWGFDIGRCQDFSFFHDGLDIVLKVSQLFKSLVLHSCFSYFVRLLFHYSALKF